MIQQRQLLIVSSLALLCLHYSEAACKYKGKQICEGAVTKEFKKSVRICTEGKVLKKKREEIEPGYPLAGGGLLLIINIHMLLIIKYAGLWLRGAEPYI